jgi:hypothetical protein
MANNTSNYVYIRDEEHIWVPGRLIDNNTTTTGKATVQVPVDVHLSTTGHCQEETVDLAHFPNKVLPLQNVNENGEINEVEDMVHLPFLHEVRAVVSLAVNSRP